MLPQVEELVVEELPELNDALIPEAVEPARRPRPPSTKPIRSSKELNATLLGIPAEAVLATNKPYSHVAIDPKPPTVDLADRKTAALELVTWCASQLSLEKDAVKKARLHYEQARLFETTLDDSKQALKHYQLAHAQNPNNLPVLLGLVRVRCKTEQWESTLGPLRECIALSDRPEEKAALHALRAAILEEHLDKPREARSEYEKGAALAPKDGALIYQLYRSARRDQDWDAVQEALARFTELAQGDVEWAAALVAERARVAEYQRKKSGEALPLYERAFELAPRVTSAAFALSRLYAQRGLVEEQIKLFQTRAGLLSDPVARSSELVSAGALRVRCGGEFPSAVQLFESAYQANHDDRTILYRLRQTYADSGHHDGVLTALLRLEPGATDPIEIAELNVAMGQLLVHELKRPKDAIARFEKAISIAPPTRQAVDALVEAYEANRQFDRVVSVLLRAEHGSDNEEYRLETHLKLARILEHELKDPERAIIHLQAALGLNPDNQEASRQLIRLLEERERFEEVIELHERTAENAESDEVFFAELFMIGELLEYRMNEPERAISTYKRVLERKADHIGAFFRLQRAAQRAGKFDVLVEAYLGEAAVHSSKKQRLALLHSAAKLCEERLSDHERALSLFQRVIREEPLRKETLLSLSQYYARHGRRAEQLETMEQLLKCLTEPHQRYPELAHMGRIAEFNLGDHDAALSYYKRAFEIAPQRAELSEAVERILHKSGRKEDLAAHLELQQKAMPASPERAFLSLRLGELYEWGLTKLPQAQAAYSAAIADMPELSTAHAGLIRVLEQRPDHEKTEAALQEQAKRTSDPMLALWSVLRAAELSESLAPKGGRGHALFGQLLGAYPKQAQSVLAMLRGGDDVTPAQLKQAISALSDKTSQHALLREILRLSMKAGSEEDVMALARDVLGIESNDRLALFLAELDALKKGNEQALLQSDQWTVDALTHTQQPSLDVVSSAYQTRLGEYLESKNAVLSLQLQKSALEKDGTNLGAARALSRLAEVIDDYELLVQSAEREASIVQDTARACKMLIRASELAIHSNRTSLAADCLKRALAIHPSSVHAAKALYELLSASGDYVDLSATLRQAAESCADLRISVEHWISVARIAADKRDDLNEAIFVLDHLEKKKRGNIHSSLELAELLLRNRQWDKAIAQLQKSIALGPDAAMLISLRLRLAEVYHVQLTKFADASRELKEVLKVDPHHQGALRRLLAIQMKEGAPAAIETAQKLVSVASGKEKAEAQLSLGRLQLSIRKHGEAVTSFCEAISIVGLQPPDASEELRKVLNSPEGAKLGWNEYEEALQTFAQSSSPSEHQARIYRELGRVKAQHDLPTATAILSTGLKHNPGDFALRRLYSELLKEQRQFELARVQLGILVAQEPTNTACWEDLMIVEEALLHTQEADLARGALTILGGGSDHQKQLWRSRVPGFTLVPVGAIGGQTLNDALVEPVSPEALLLLDQLNALAGKVFVPNLLDFGVSPRGKISARGNHQLRPVVDRVCQCLGGIEVDLYVADNATQASLVLTDPIGIVLPMTIQNLSEAEQVFVVARLLANIPRGAAAVDALELNQLRLLFGASARLIEPGAIVTEVNEGELLDTTKRLGKVLPWLSRGRIEDAARRYVAAGNIDVAHFRKNLRDASDRIALVFSDDLGMVERMLSGQAEILGINEQQAEELGQRLLGFWSSSEAFALRRALGLMS